MPSEKKVSDGIRTEARTTRACVPHTPYKWDLGFMQATELAMLACSLVRIVPIIKVNSMIVISSVKWNTVWII